MSDSQIIRVALAGNPNSGKTTLFNAITGLRQKTGNYPGVTVEKKEGTRKYNDKELIFYDLPGIYSLTAYSIDEVIARDFILEERPDIIVDVLDSTNIERNLFLALQFQELGLPVVGALNIWDQAEKWGITIDEKKLSDLLGIPLVKTIAKKEEGIEKLLDTILVVYEKTQKKEKINKNISYGYEIEIERAKLRQLLELDSAFSSLYPSQWMSIKLLEKDANAFLKLRQHQYREKIEAQLKESIQNIEKHFDRDSEIAVSEQRYAYVHGAVKETVSKKIKDTIFITEKIDKILLHRFLSLPIFLLLLWAIFQATFSIGNYPMSWLESFFQFLSRVLTNHMEESMVRSLLVDGIIGGLGGVLSFVPLIILLFFFISLLEDTGYMARAAFIMDKFLHIFGLHGQSFLPMLIGFGCSVPAIMATRTLKNQRDRIITILVTPFMSCGAKLPVHILLAATFFPENAGNVVFLIYLVGVVLALFSAKIFRKTVLRGEETPFVMELPPYRLPTAKNLFWHIWGKAKQYLKKAGTVLLAASILIWAMLKFPLYEPLLEQYQRIEQEYRERNKEAKKELEEKIKQWIAGKIKETEITEQNKIKYEEIKSRIMKGESTIEKEVETLFEEEVKKYLEILQREEELTHSFAGRIGRSMEGFFKPLGFDWKIGISIVTGFAAKEVIVSTLGVLYRVGSEENEESESLREALRKDSHFNPLVALGLMLFTLILAPCIAAMATIRAEAGWKWLGFYVVYSIVLAWVIVFGVYQLGQLFF